MKLRNPFVAAALVYWNYLPAFHRLDPRLERTAGVFTTFPAFPGQPMAGLLDQTIGTALLLLMVLAITDERNQPPGANLTPVLIGLVVVAIGMTLGSIARCFSWHLSASGPQGNAPVVEKQNSFVGARCRCA